MRRMVSWFLGLLPTLGGLVLYWAALLMFGVKPAIAVAIVFVLMDGGRRFLARQPFPPIWLIGNGGAIVFGFIDLYARTPFMIRYEGVVLNLVWAVAFAIGAFGREPLVLRFARSRAPDIPDRPEVIRFFRTFTMAWCLFFVIRAATLLWIMHRFALAEAIAIRAAFSWISMGGMLLVSFHGRRVFDLCRGLGFFVSSQE